MIAADENGYCDEAQPCDDQNDLQNISLDDGQLAAHCRVEGQRQSDGQSSMCVGDVDNGCRNFRCTNDLRGDDTQPGNGDDACRQFFYAIAIEAFEQGREVVALKFRKWFDEK